MEEGTSYGRPSYKAGGRFFIRLRAEDASLVLQEVGFEAGDADRGAPDTFHFTDHYRDHPIVLARIAWVSLQGFLERRWCKIAPKAAVKTWNQARA